MERIRKFLQKTLLPVIEKVEEVKSKIRLSMEFQISIINLVLIIIAGVVVFFPVGCVIYGSELKDLQFMFHYSNQNWNFKCTDVFRVAVMLYVIGAFVVIELSKRNIKKITDKMDVIVKSTNRITINNLEQERLNIDGIQNEMKEIATTINHMLDRLDVSYEQQKQFVSDVSHELRTPIAVIQGYINMLDRWGAEDPEILTEAVDAIKNESQTMKELVEKLLFLSRNDKKTLRLEKHKFNVGKMVLEMVKDTQMLATDRKVEKLDIDSAILYGDRQMIKEALRVLIENAIKYTQSGDTIYIGCENVGKKCILTVADTGMGMEQADMERIFQRFYRSDRVRNNSISGHGLGLSIAKLIVQKHVGTIEVSSQYTRGTCFRITLPLMAY